MSAAEKVANIATARQKRVTEAYADGRPMPSNVVVENALLFELMSPELGSADAQTATRLLSPDHFFSPVNALLFEAIQKLVADGAVVDKLTVFAKVKHLPPPIGGWYTYITETIPADGAHAEARPADYAKIVLEKWRARETLKVLAGTMDQLFAGHESVPAIDATCSALAVIQEVQAGGHGLTVRDALIAAWRNLISTGTGHGGVSWGWKVCDERFGKFRGKRVTVIAAVPGVGKTNAAWHIAEAAANAPEDENGIGDAVYFVSAELKAEELVGRQAGIRAGVPVEAIEGDRPLRTDEVGRLVEAQRDIETMPIVVDDNEGRAFTVSQIEARVRDAKRRFEAGTYTTRDGVPYTRNRVRLVVVDYLQKLRPPPKPAGQRYDSREQEVAAISNALTELAKTLDVHVLVISAVSRGDKKNGEEAKRRELTMSDLRESGAIEYDAATIVFLNEPEPGRLKLKNAKQRFRDQGEPVFLTMERGRIFEEGGR